MQGKRKRFPFAALHLYVSQLSLGLSKTEHGSELAFQAVALQLQISKSGPLGLHSVNKLTP